MISDETLATINRLRNEPLIAAARYGDAIAEKYAGDLAQVLAHLGLPETRTMLHVATQRLLRLRSYVPESINTLLKGESVDSILAAIILDAVTIGWVGRHFHDHGVLPEWEVGPFTKQDVQDFDAKMREKK